MQASKPLTHRVQALFAERLFDAWKQYVLFQPHVVVKKFSQPRHFLRFDRSLCRKPLLEIQHGRTNLGVVGEHSHDFGVAIEPPVSRKRWEQYFLLFAKMYLPRLVPEANKLLRLPLDCRRAFLLGRFRRAPHLQRLNQREMMVLAKWVQTQMAFHCSAVLSVYHSEDVLKLSVESAAAYELVRPMG
jgi:hypothetical protein